MAGYAVVRLGDVPNSFAGRWPGEFRMLKDVLGTEQVAVTHRIMPHHTGAKGGYGHFHKEQEEVVFVISGTLLFKLDDVIEPVTGPAAVRISPGTVWGMWNDEADDAHLLIISNRLDHDDFERVDGFWPAD